MTTFHVTSAFPTGTVGTVTFRRKEWLASATEGIVPPQTVVATITSNAIDQVLRATTETGVSPSFQYEVTLAIVGQSEMRGFLELTANSELADIFNWTTPPNPDIFVTRQEFEEAQAAAGNPASQAALDTEVAARIAGDNGLDSRLDAEEALSTSFDTRLDAEEALSLTFDSRLDNAEADIGTLDTDLAAAEAELALIPTPVGAANGKVLKVLSNAFVLADDATGGGGSGGGLLGRATKTSVGLTVVAHGTSVSDYVSADLRVTFTVPADGAVLVNLSSYLRTSAGSPELYWGLRDLSNVLVQEHAVMVSDSNPGIRANDWFLVTGLTPAASLTWKWTLKLVGGGTGGDSMYGNVVGPALMTVWDATLPP